MIYTDATFTLLEQVDNLATVIIQSEVYQKYQQAKKALNNPQTKQKEQKFSEQKQAYEEISMYGKYAPNYKEVKRDLCQAKKELDLDEAVASFKRAETDLQLMLDEVTASLASCISEDIKLVSSNPLRQRTCGGCHCGKRT